MAVAAWAALHLWLLGLLIVGRPLRAGRRWWAGWAPLVALLVWWHTLRPSNDRDWADEVSRMPQGTVQGDHVRLRDVRNFDWRGDADYDARWDTRDYDLSRLRSVDMILSTWGMPAIAPPWCPLASTMASAWCSRSRSARNAASSSRNWAASSSSSS